MQVVITSKARKRSRIVSGWFKKAYMDGGEREKEKREGEEKEEKSDLNSNSRFRILSVYLPLGNSTIADRVKAVILSEPLIHIPSKLASIMLPIREVWI
jgi:hypothetical protein